jgi:hypothetical protein
MQLTPPEVEAVWVYVTDALRELRPHFERLDLRLSAPVAARRLGFRDGVGFEAWLRAQDLPRFREIRDGCHLATLHHKGRDAGSLGALADANGVYASVYTRFIARVYGAGWRELRILSDFEVRHHVASMWAASRPRLLRRSGDR